MTDQTPLISLCIPTYNRAALLREALQAVLAQWQGELDTEHQARLEVVISDNCSSDGTVVLVQEITRTYPRLRVCYHRQPENKGADANILNAAALATGDYVYLLSDDDILLPGAIAGMFSLIREHPSRAAFCLNTRSFVSDPAEETPVDFPVSADRAIDGRDECLTFLGTRITFISLLLFRRGTLSAEAYAPRVGSCLLQSYLYIDVLAECPALWVTQRPFLATRDNNTGGYNFFEVFVSRFGDLMRYARQRGYSEKAVDAVLARHLRRFLTPFVVAFKVRGSYGRLRPDFPDAARRLRAEYGADPLLVFGLLPLMFAPVPIAKALHAVGRTLKGRRAR